MWIKTVGELREALKDLDAGRPIFHGAFGCKNSIKAVEIAPDGDVILLPVGLGDLFGAGDHVLVGTPP